MGRGCCGDGVEEIAWAGPGRAQLPEDTHLEHEPANLMIVDSQEVGHSGEFLLC